MALSAKAALTFKGQPIESSSPAQAVAVYGGGAQSRDSGGEVGPLAASEAFAGFAINSVDNSGGSAGDLEVPLYVEGIVLLTITGLNDNDDIGDTVYATADNVFTLTASGAVSIGKVYQIKSLTDGTAWVYFQSDTRRSI